jgi:hypothetical protein
MLEVDGNRWLDVVSFVVFVSLFLWLLGFISRRLWSRPGPDKPSDDLKPPKEPAMAMQPPFIVEEGKEGIDDADAERDKRIRKRAES